MTEDKILKAFEDEFILGNWDLGLGDYKGMFLAKCADITKFLIDRETTSLSAKVIALNAAIKITPPYFDGAGGELKGETDFKFIARCEAIHQWLIKE